jgi:hypothetical protein
MDAAELLQSEFGHIAEYPARSTMIDFIMTNSAILNYEEKVEVARYLAKVGGREHLLSVAAGLAVDLAKLPDACLEVVYDMLCTFKERAGSV